MAHLDWYQATVQEYPRVLVDALMEMPGAVDVQHGRGRYNYTNRAEVIDGSGDVLATVYHGGKNGAPNASGTGERAEAFARILRDHWPDAHRVTRVDSAEDFTGDFDAMVPVLRAIAAERGISGRMTANDSRAEGDTYNLGKPSSSVQLRFYEKAKQLVSTKRCRADEVNPDWLRLEVEWHPVRDAREKAATMHAEQIWGVSALTRHIASEVLSRAPERVVVRPRLRTTWEQRVEAFRRQYGGLMRDMLRDHGSWDLVGVEIGRLLDAKQPDDDQE